MYLQRTAGKCQIYVFRNYSTVILFFTWFELNMLVKMMNNGLWGFDIVVYKLIKIWNTKHWKIKLQHDMEKLIPRLPVWI